MKIGILGSGFMGGNPCPRLCQDPRRQHRGGLVAQSRQGGEARARKSAAARPPTTARSSRIPSIDAISNTLPTHLHAETTIAALKAGKHVLLEKPFALTAADCDGMIAAAKETGRTLMVAHVLRFWGEYVSLVELRAERQARQADFGGGDAAFAASGLGRLVPQPGLERRRGARPLRP